MSAATTHINLNRAIQLRSALAGPLIDLRLWQCQPTLNDAPCKLHRQIGHDQVCNRPIGCENPVALACSTKRAKCMTLSVLETSLPMQRSHGTLALGISA